MNPTKEKIITKLQELGIEELKSVKELNELNGDYINLTCKLPNGETGKILNDKKKYLGNQVEEAGTDNCYGIAADETQIAVYRYGCNGKDAELMVWLAL
jgi:hypothetical protein